VPDPKLAFHPGLLTFAFVNNKKPAGVFAMTMYRARACPRCQYYVGYCLSKPIHGTPECSIKSFCLNCNYQFPVHAVIRGTKDSTPRLKTLTPAGPLQAAKSSRYNPRSGAPQESTGSEGLAPGAKNYSRELRAIGQELEKRRFTTFNLKCSGDSYFVWSTETAGPSLLSDAGHAVAGRWTLGCYTKADDPETKMLLDRMVGCLFSPDDIKRLEFEGVQNRRRESGGNAGRRLSHLLRTIGEQVYRRRHRLLAISWQDHQTSVVSEAARGRREINVFRSDNLYDLWVRMYLQRSR
jgi:hypothetical protein